MKVVIIGAGQAGVQAAWSLRDFGFSGEIDLFGSEQWLPYQRPPLSKQFLLQEYASAEGLLLRSKAALEQKAITFHAQAVTQVDKATQTITAGNSTRYWDKLILATGGVARQLDVVGADVPKVHYLRTIEDAKAIAHAAHQARSVLIVGGGFIGLEVAASLASLGLKVHVVYNGDRVLDRAVCADMSAYFESLHRHKGVVLTPQCSVHSIAAHGDSINIRLTNGETTQSDMVVAGIGLVIDSPLFEQLGIQDARGGVAVDEAGQTAVPNVYAAGDCTWLPHYETGEMIRLESVQNAINQGRQIASHIMNTYEYSKVVPTFWSNQYHIKWQQAGLIQSADAVVTLGDKQADKFSHCYFSQDALCAVVSINSPANHLQACKLLALDGTATMDQVRGATTLKALL